MHGLNERPSRTEARARLTPNHITLFAFRPPRSLVLMSPRNYVMSSGQKKAMTSTRGIRLPVRPVACHAEKGPDEVVGWMYYTRLPADRYEVMHTASSTPLYQGHQRTNGPCGVCQRGCVCGLSIEHHDHRVLSDDTDEKPAFDPWPSFTVSTLLANLCSDANSFAVVTMDAVPAARVGLCSK